MTFTTRIGVLFCMSSALSLAGNWSGVLVDSRCWASEESNINPDDTSIYVDRDRSFEINACKPKAKTKSFTLVNPDGTSLRLDSAGDAKAAELVRTAGKERIYRVAVKGNVNQRTLNVDSIAIAP